MKDILQAVVASIPTWHGALHPILQGVHTKQLHYLGICFWMTCKKADAHAHRPKLSGGLRSYRLPVWFDSLFRPPKQVSVCAGGAHFRFPMTKRNPFLTHPHSLLFVDCICAIFTRRWVAVVYLLVAHISSFAHNLFSYQWGDMWARLFYNKSEFMQLFAYCDIGISRIVSRYKTRTENR